MPPSDLVENLEDDTGWPGIEVLAGDVKLTYQGVDGTKHWTLEAESAEGKFDPNEAFSNLQNVRLVIYQEDKPFLFLKGDRGRGEKGRGTFSVEGNVVATSEDQQMELLCDRINWTNDIRLLFAEGNVRGVAGGIRMDGADEAQASFVSIDDEMSSSGTVALMLASLVVQGQHTTYRDRAGNLIVTELSLWSITPSEDRKSWILEGEGEPFKAEWRKQGITISARKMTVKMLSLGEGEQQRFELVSGEFSGGISAEMEGDAGKMTLKGVSEWRMTLSEDGETWSFVGDGRPFSAEFPEKGFTVQGRHVEGAAKQIGTGDQKTVEWQSAKFTGGVTAVFVQQPEEGAAQDKPIRMTANCPTVLVNRAASEIVLSGGVRLEGEHPSLGPGGAELTGPRIVITFDEDMREIIKITGEPGG